MKKSRIISFLLVLCFAFTMLTVGAESGKAILEICPPEELPKAGESFEVAVKLSNNPGFSGIEFTLTYDNEIMECTDMAMDGVLAGITSATNPTAKDGALMKAVSLREVKGDGSIVLYLFTAKEDITDFGFKLKDIVLVDEDISDIEYEVAGGNEYVEVPSSPEDTEDTENEEDEPVNTRPSGGGSSSFKEPEEEKTEENEPVKESAFADVAGHWAEEFVNEAAKQGLFKGDANGNFNPDSNVTRAQFVTVLWRMAGAPEVNAELPFADVENQIPEFKSAIAWGYANGYINGVSETSFDPEGTLTREAGMKILHFYSGGKSGAEIQLHGVYDGIFKDSGEISDWAKSSIYWGVYNKLLAGTTATELSPKGTATRAQLAKILINYLNINN